jgi:energy-coupling factor transporter ATP-binding protein EcfA2
VRSRSADDWVEQIALQLLDGRRILVRGLPRSGKTWLAQAVASTLQETALTVRGRNFEEGNQATLRETIISDLDDRLQEHRSVQLIFDDYHLALRRTQGKRLQARLVARLIDSPLAQDTGALFLARQSSVLHLPMRGSPLVSRLQVVQQPRWSAADIQDSCPKESVEYLASRLGMSIPNLIQYLSADGDRYKHHVQRLAIDGPSILDDLPPNSLQALAGSKTLAELDESDIDQMVGLVWQSDEQSLSWVDAVHDADLRSMLSGGSGSWPAEQKNSAEKFSALVAGCEGVIWSDRFMFVDPDSLAKFLLAVRSVSGIHMQLLGSDWDGATRIDARNLRTVAAIAGVELRFMTFDDRKALHDRHLARRGEAGGWVLPTVDVILSQKAPGSALATKAPRFTLNYEKVWGRSRVLQF